MIARFSGFTLDSGRRQLLRGAEEVHLTPKAFDLLVFLLTEAPRIVRKAELHEYLWPDTFVADSTLVGLVKELRRALKDDDPAQPLLRTAHRVGYGFGGPVERVDDRTDVSDVTRWLVLPARTIQLVPGENLIGRHPASLVSLDAAGVSRRHARILVSEQGARLEDLGSKNGTLVREGLLQGSVLLRDGDRIQVGPIAIVYRESSVGRSTETGLVKP